MEDVVIAFVVTIALLSLSPDFRFSVDRRECDGYRYTEICGGLFQQPTTWTCLEVPRV